MNWYSIANTDWRIYSDVERIRQFVIKGKISAEQFTEITKVAY